MHLALVTLLAWEFAAVPSDEIVNQFADRTYQYTGGDYKDEAFHYRVLKPATVEPGKKYPLVLFLHGAGERGDDNLNQLQYLPAQMATEPWRTQFPCFLIAPQCRKDKKWVEIDWARTESEPMKEPGDQMRVVLGILDEALKTLPIDDRRVYLTGLSMGGYGSWDLAMQRPTQFAAVVPICGGGDEAHAARIAKLPIWVFHGSEDKSVVVDRSRRMVAALKAAGGEPKYSELEGVGHNSWTPAYSDPNGVLKWMFEQVRK